MHKKWILSHDSHWDILHALQEGIEIGDWKAGSDKSLRLHEITRPLLQRALSRYVVGKGRISGLYIPKAPHA